MSTTATTQIPTGTWSIDPIHSSIGFGVKHLGISTFRGDFKQAAGTLVSADDAITSIEGTVRVENLVTEEPGLTGHLHSPDFFDAGTFPELTFKSTSIEQAGEDALKITGDLTLRGETRPVVLDAEIEGVGPGADGSTRIGLAATGVIERSQWGITWNAPLANGAFAVGERVKLTLHVEASLQA
jgi:polyisoprenoid-binding protein YceI